MEKYIRSADRMPGITVDKFVIMPNHVHMIVFVQRVVEVADPYKCNEVADPYNAQIPRFVGALKRFYRQETGEQLFQRSYHDHVIRSEKDYLKIWQYIDTNPTKWKEDCFYNEE